MSLITGAFGGLWAKVLLVGAIVLAVLAILAGARSAGRSAERLEQEKKINEAVTRKTVRQRAADIMSDADVDARVREQRDELKRILRSR